MDHETLVKALSAGEAVAFVGAGVSASSGLPLWHKFIKDFLEFAQGRLRSDDHTLASKLLSDGQLLLVAETLQRGLDRPIFNSYVKDIFDTRRMPNAVHKSIVRLPFCLAITTNFDTLLEAAWQSPPTHTYKAIEPVFDSIRSKTFAILKVHGSITDPGTLRLTSSHYQHMGDSNLQLWECLRALLNWKTFLFVGHSLRDSDLLSIMSEARMRFGDNFGPHYAILPRSEVSEAYRAYLKSQLAIECIEYEIDPAHVQSHESGIVKILKKLAGDVAKLDTKVPGIDNFSIPRVQAAQAVLDVCIRLTGSFRGEVCMIESDAEPGLARVIEWQPFEWIKSDLQPVKLDSVIHTVFLQANSSGKEDYIYLPNVSSLESVRDRGYRNVEYVECHESVRSELALPIVTDGRRVGVLNLESDIEDAYTPEHIEVASKFTEQLGQIYLHSERRRRASEPLGFYYQHPDKFEELLRNSRLIRMMDHDFLLYQIDYENEYLVAHHANDRRMFSWSFDEPSLARQVFRERKSIFIPDAQKELLGGPNRKTQLAMHGVDHFKISGPVFACPVRVSGQTEAVLVTWLKPASPFQTTRRPDKSIEGWFLSSSGQASRLANLLANDIYDFTYSRATGFLDQFYKSLRVTDNEEIWTYEKLSSVDFRKRIIFDLMSALLSKECGFRCVRIYRTMRKEKLTYRPDVPSPMPRGFECIYSLTEESSTDPEKDSWNAYKDVTATENNLYCRYTIARFSHDPFAKWQHPGMFGKPDVNCKKLKKDRNGSWIVAPIVWPSFGGKLPQLLGFISADSHDRSSDHPIDKSDRDPRGIALQCRMMDVVSELARHVIAAELREKGVQLA